MTTIQLMHNKKTMRVKVAKMTVYKQAKIIEATSKKNQTYYLFFYKDRYINAKKTTSIKLQSFLKTALQSGISFAGNHPLIHVLLQEDTYRLTANNQMVQKLSNKYSELETLYILAMFDNYVNNKKITALCKNTFYNYRRNGQLKKAFRIIANYAQVRPHDPFVKEMLQHFDFQKYKEQYRNLDQLTKEWSDPLYLESVYFEQHFPESVINTFIEQYDKEKRKFDLLLLTFIKCTSKNMVIKLEQLITEQLDKEDQIALWGEVLTQYPKPQEIIDILVKVEGYSEILHYYLHHTEAINDRALFEKVLTMASSKRLATNYRAVLHALIYVYKNDTAQLERTLHQTIKKLLPHLSLKEIITELKNTELPIMQKLQKMDQFSDNPDKQFALGEIYFDLEQYDQAIACFEWEMELSPNDPAPIQYLYKSYLAKGDQTQANNYKQLMTNISS
ncbi:hypothetical protein SH601_13015 [Gracilibacillus sp. S3-1-1]|uniref:Uncharacterized protein n=1 Tax=Gracilibacillus pellucidus TaxID=3095368 RepID=A0ACC6M7T5_9BACI|nr:hypothetical protein [Gracilibacillus sp. S3-1-1]MDX8046907.1 hypothetical protein [Gracilibacillus sp. S3-1-1]